MPLHVSRVTDTVRSVLTQHEPTPTWDVGCSCGQPHNGSWVDHIIAVLERRGIPLTTPKATR